MMKTLTILLAPILLLTLLFPALAQGQSLNDWVGKGKGLLCETTGMGCPESVDFKDLVETDGIYYKKYTDVPFTGTVTGPEQGYLINGRWDGPWVRYNENGKLEEKVTYKNGQRRGSWVGYHRNGKLRSQKTYKDGKEDGPSVAYDDNGRLEYKVTFKDGKKHGPWSAFRFNGQVRDKATYKNNERHGPWIYYHKNGKLGSKGTFKDGKKHGPWVFYTDNGTKRFTAHRYLWDEGTGTYKNGVKVD
jgi:antitoxin component YwqK of YwqJK toxin-antitoxin module